MREGVERVKEGLERKVGEGEGGEGEGGGKEKGG